MRICRFNEDRIGLVDENEIVDITDLARDAGVHPPEKLVGDPLVMALPAIAAAVSSGAAKGSRLPIEAVRLECPVRFPTKIVTAGNNYKAHAAEMAANSSSSSYDLFTDGVFIKATSSLIGPSDSIKVRFPDRRTDHEVELVGVIGRVADNVSAKDALAYVAGYCVGLDITMRGKEERSLRKSFDTYTALGPWIVSADEIVDPSNIQLSLHLNGEKRQATSTSDMVVSLAELIAYASKFYALRPGDLIYTGTPSGVGPIKAGDKIRIEADLIGSMSIPVEAFEKGKFA
jgi:2,4-diketo-3-deoxy-L-fuconate hydrolase